MPLLNTRRFSDHDSLGKIKPECLLAWLEPARDYLARQGVSLPYGQLGATECRVMAEATSGSGNKTQLLAETAGSGLNLEQLEAVFMEPQPDMPAFLVDSLYLIAEMATEPGMDAILDAVQERGLELATGTDPAPADVAVQAWLLDRSLLEDVHVQHQLTRPRSFEYYSAEAEPLPQLVAPEPEALRALEARLDQWYSKRKRGTGCRVRAFSKEGECWFLVRHGQPCRREGVMAEEGNESVFYRPQKHDVLVYNIERGEMRINCCGKRELQEFLKAFGLHVFGDEHFFPSAAKYDLTPLLSGRDCLACGDVPGIESVTLREVVFFFGGKPWQRITRQSEDIFALLERELFRWPTADRITRAGFEVAFTGSKRTRRVTIIGSNKAQYGRDDDSLIVESWLKRRGFILEPAAGLGEASAPMNVRPAA